MEKMCDILSWVKRKSLLQTLQIKKTMSEKEITWNNLRFAECSRLNGLLKRNLRFFYLQFTASRFFAQFFSCTNLFSKDLSFKTWALTKFFHTPDILKLCFWTKMCIFIQDFIFWVYDVRTKTKTNFKTNFRKYRGYFKQNSWSVWNFFESTLHSFKICRVIVHFSLKFIGFRKYPHFLYFLFTWDENFADFWICSRFFFQMIFTNWRHLNSGWGNFPNFQFLLNQTMPIILMKKISYSRYSIFG